MRSIIHTTLILSSTLLSIIPGYLAKPTQANDTNTANNQTEAPPTGNAISTSNPSYGRHRLIWEDNFNRPLNERYWNYNIGDGCDINLCGWGNGETEWYDRPNVKSGPQSQLKITALRNRNGNFTSGKIDTKNKFSFLYGRIDARAKLPANDGAFPAIWLLPVNDTYGGWPKSGEIDVTETQNSWFKTRGSPGTAGSLHFQNHFGGNAISNWASNNDPTQWHVYSVLWYPDHFEFLVDNKKYGEYKPPTLDNPDDWPYNQPFYILVNLAIEPSWGSRVPANLTSFGMALDWIRVTKLT